MTPDRLTVDEAGQLPASFGLALDPATRAVDGGRVLIGGSPLRIMRLTAAGAEAVASFVSGATVGASAARQRLARRLLVTGLAHPRPIGAPFTAADVTCVVPTFGDAAGLERTLRALHDHAPAVHLVVVDDASSGRAAGAIAAAADRWGAELVVRGVNGGPGAARNTGLARAATPVVAFVDRDVEPTAGWLDPLLTHLADPQVVAVAPRVRPVRGEGARSRFEAARSPLDLGPREARVAAGSRVAYVPSTTLVARRGALQEAGGYAEELRVGEDVDLVWRLAERGHTVRYEPQSVVLHPTRPTLGGWVAQRFAYGRSAALLDERHPGAVPPVALSGWTLGAWGLAAAGHPVLGVGVVVATTAMLPPKLGALEHPWREAVRLGGAGQLRAWEPLASALTRTWWPVTLAGAVVSRRVRRVAVLAAVVPAAREWARSDRALDPVRFTALRLLDDAAYGAGVWAGCIGRHRAGPLRPALRSWPGRRRDLPAAAE